MKKLLLFCMAACVAAVASAQKVYFLYLQTDDQAPFYVRMSDKIYSSAVSGFLILPNLTDSTYNLSVGFAKSTRPETRFNVAINQNDRGFLIKNFDESLSLFDLQNLSLIKAATFNKDNATYETKSDKFSSVLSKAADDPSLLKVAVTKKEEVKARPEQKEIVAKPDEPKPDRVKDSSVAPVIEIVEKKDKAKEIIVKSDTATIEKSKAVEEVNTSVVKEQALPVVPSIDYKPSVVIRRSESSTTEGLGVVYLDKAENKTDTIRILIPPSKIKFAQETEVSPTVDSQKKTETTASPVSQGKVDSVAIEKKETVETKPALSSCGSVASDKDFMKLRKNMAAKSSDEEMISEAKKSFRAKCFTAEQIRYLSTLFLTSAAKYEFFDAAYAHTSDKQNFSGLQTELKDAYYIKRFKALVGE